ncbi:MAG: hypothetical protein RMX97_20980 [Nostoc sp. DedQUE11]|nr:hypothetical protein [Nostoc sp. DedQUE11]
MKERNPEESRGRRLSHRVRAGDRPFAVQLVSDRGRVFPIEPEA